MGGCTFLGDEVENLRAVIIVHDVFPNQLGIPDYASDAWFAGADAQASRQSDMTVAAISSISILLSKNFRRGAISIVFIYHLRLSKITSRLVLHSRVAFALTLPLYSPYPN
jgi:hypothetical protein